MEMIDPADVLDWSVDYDQPITAANWSVTPAGGVTVAGVTIDADNGTATVKISGNNARLGGVYRVVCAATIAGGLTDRRTATYRVGPKAVS